jgi:hypothetical protein
LSLLALPVLTIALLTCSAALFFGEYRPAASLPAATAGYLSNDADAVQKVQSALAAGATTWPSAEILFRETVRRDASSPQRWCELGEAFARSGDPARAEYAYLRGAALGPNAPAILLDLGDYYFNAGKYRLSLPSFAKILTTVRDPGDGYLQNVFNYYEKMGVRQNNWLDEAIPDGEAARAYLAFLLRSPEAGPATGLWDWAGRHGFIDDEATNRYTDFLLQKRQFDTAAQVWTERYTGRDYDCPGPSCVFNGDFEHPFTGGAFDWRFAGGNGIKLNRDAITRYEGRYSLRVDFSAQDNPDFRGISEQIALRPGLYRLQGYVRTSGITSDEGIRLSIAGYAGTKNLRAETAAVIGTENWTRLFTEFQVPEGLRQANVSIARHKSIRIDNQLSGTAWIDSIRLTRLQ